MYTQIYKKDYSLIKINVNYIIIYLYNLINV